MKSSQENQQIITVRRDTKIVWSYLIKQYALQGFLKLCATFDGLQTYTELLKACLSCLNACSHGQVI